jgi:hypothetical protein
MLNPRLQPGAGCPQKNQALRRGATYQNEVACHGMKTTFFNALHQHGDRHEFSNYLKINVLELKSKHQLFF